MFEQHVKQQEGEQLLEKWKPFWILEDNKPTILRVREIKTKHGGAWKTHKHIWSQSEHDIEYLNLFLYVHII